MKIKIRDFKGLYTNIDPADKPAEYFSKFRNIEIKEGYITGKRLNYVDISNKFNFDGVVVKQAYVFLDEDKLKKKYNSVKKTLEYDYKQNIQKFLLSIVLKDGYVVFYLDNDKVTNLGAFKFTAGEVPKIIERKNTLIILLKSGAVWLGKLHRTILDENDQPKVIYNGYYAEPYIDQYADNMIPFDINTLTSNEFNEQTKELLVYSEIINDWDAEIEYEGLLYKASRVAFYDHNTGEPIKIFDSFNGSNGALVAFCLDKFAFSEQKFYCIHCNTFDKVFINNQYPFSQTFRSKIALPGWDRGLLLTNGQYADSLIHEEFYIFPQRYFYEVFGKDQKKEMLINPSTTVFSTDTSFKSNMVVEIAVTSIIDGNETIKYYKKLDTKNTDFIIKLKPKSELINYYNVRKEGYSVYLRAYDKTEDKTLSDFEQVYTYLIYGNKQTFPVYFNKLSPNGIMLTQTIGKYFVKDTYSILTSFDDYVDVAGVPYALKNGNVYYPAVGGGNILSNFYQENTIPGIKGSILSVFGNLLGVFIAQKEEMLLIDFTPAESQMVFYIKDKQEYKIKDRKDIIETSEGVFIHLRNGIYLSNGRERTLISEPINDIVIDYYDTGNIFYSSYLKQLFYINSAGIYVFDFRSKAWIQYDFPSESTKGKDGK